MMRADKSSFLCSGDPNMQQFVDMASELEKQELEAPDGIASPQIYGQLLAIYLLQNDLSLCSVATQSFLCNVNPMRNRGFTNAASNFDSLKQFKQRSKEQIERHALTSQNRPNAKYLWKRIPSNIKEENPELGKLWSVGQKLWQCISSVYGALSEEWPEYLKPIISVIAETTRKRAFTLISKAYCSISVEKVSAFLGMPAEECVEVLSSLGWEVDTACKIMKPKNNESKQEEIIVSEEQLTKLTDFVSFLEN